MRSGRPVQAALPSAIPGGTGPEPTPRIAAGSGRGRAEGPGWRLFPWVSLGFGCRVFVWFGFLFVCFIFFFFCSAPARREPPRQPGPAAGTGERGPGPALPQHRDLERATGSRELSSAGSTGRRSRPAATPRLAPPAPPSRGAERGAAALPARLPPSCATLCPFHFISFSFLYFLIFLPFPSPSIRFCSLCAVSAGSRYLGAGGRLPQTPSGGSGPTAARRHIWRPRTPRPRGIPELPPRPCPGPSAATIAAAPGDARCRAAEPRCGVGGHGALAVSFAGD